MHNAIQSPNLADKTEPTGFVRQRPLPRRHPKPKLTANTLSITLDLLAIPQLPATPDGKGSDPEAWHAWTLYEIARLHATKAIQKALYDAGAPRAATLASISWVRLIQGEAERCALLHTECGGTQGPALVAAIAAAAA